jgi:NADPH:quinone reductase-like Zn-dependent oxidoreductase
MKAIELRQGFGFESLTATDRPQPTPERSQVLVRLQAASLNYRDLQVVHGEYQHLQLPLIPVSDGAGEVVEVGSSVTRFRVGDRVCPCYMPDWIEGAPTPESVARRLGGTVDGVLAEYICVSEQSAVRIPESISPIAAATFPIAGVTAWNALFAHRPLLDGQTVVVHGTGGVSIFALQLARAVGARVIVISKSDEKLRRLQSVEEIEVVNRTISNWSEEVLRLTNGVGADHVIDVVGGENLSRSIAAAKLGGVVSIVGYLESTRGTIDIPAALRRMVTLQALSVGSRTDFEALVNAAVQYQLRPVVDRVFPWTNLQDAMQYLASGKQMGKVVLTFEGS